MTDQPQLLPCPFCGSSDVEFRDVYVACLECSAWGPSKNPISSAFVQWNIRAFTNPVDGSQSIRADDYQRLMMEREWLVDALQSVIWTHACAGTLYDAACIAQDAISKHLTSPLPSLLEFMEKQAKTT